MTPVQFPGSNVVLGENQPQYRPLPAFVDDTGAVVSCWRLTWWERVRILFTGRFFLVVLTFKAPPQPVLPTISNPLEFTQNPAQ